MPKKILLIKPSALGDIALALPVLSMLRKSFPDAKISWFVRPEYKPLLDCTGELDDMIIFDRRALGKWWYSPKAFRQLVGLVRRLRREKFDLILDLQGLFRTAMFAWVSGSKKRFGMKTAREFATLFYTDKIAMEDDSVHVIDYYRKIAAAAGASDSAVEYNLSPTAQALDSIGSLLAEHGIEKHQYVVFIATSARSNKCWPVEKFAVLAEKITQQFKLSIVTAATAAEKIITSRLTSAAKVPIVDLAGLTDIYQLIALLKNARLVISNDTGPGHIAVALGIPTVLILGPTNPARVGPYQKKNSVAAVEPNHRGSAINSANPDHSIEAVSVEDVFEKVVLQLKPISEK